MKTFVVEVKRVKSGLDYLDHDDRVALWEIECHHRIEADNEEAALDIFHHTVAISCLEDFVITAREAKPLRKYYVTMTWDDWPEGGSYGTVVEAEDYGDAIRLCHAEMAASRGFGEQDGEDGDAVSYLEDYSDEWHMVDCFLLDDFIAMYSKKEEAK